MYDRDFYQDNFEKNIARLELKKNDKWNPHYHISSNTGWLNDPNGLCQFDGTYHIYFQNDPLNASRKNIIWGHVTTDDFVNYNYHDPFIFADTHMDKDGAYSGSAFIKDGEINYFYTGNVKHEGDFDYINEGREHNTIKVTSKDGFTFDQKKLILSNDDYPADLTKHVRDPKIHEEDGSYYMFLGARDKNNKGKVLVYKSEDLENFTFHMDITTDEKYGYMWECPDFFEIDGQQFLMVCPQGIESEEYRYQNIYQAGYFPIEIDFESKEYKLSDFVELDFGFDFYAPQTFEDERGHRILIGWMGMPDADYTNPTVESHWQGMMTYPRELSCCDGKIYQKPIDEICNLLSGEFSLSPNEIYKENVFDYSAVIHTNEFQIRLRKDVLLGYADGILSLSLGESGFGRDERKVKIKKIENIRILSDTSSVEVFINDGEYVITSRVYANEGYFSSSIGGLIKKIDSIRWID